MNFKTVAFDYDNSLTYMKLNTLDLICFGCNLCEAKVNSTQLHQKSSPAKPCLVASANSEVKPRNRTDGSQNQLSKEGALRSDYLRKRTRRSHLHEIFFIVNLQAQTCFSRRGLSLPSSSCSHLGKHATIFPL